MSPEFSTVRYHGNAPTRRFIRVLRRRGVVRVTAAGQTAGSSASSRRAAYDGFLQRWDQGGNGKTDTETKTPTLETKTRPVQREYCLETTQCPKTSRSPYCAPTYRTSNDAPRATREETAFRYAARFSRRRRCKRVTAARSRERIFSSSRLQTRSHHMSQRYRPRVVVLVL